MPATASSIRWIKRRAKSIKKSDGIPLHQALDAAARESGFNNLRHAQSTSPVTLQPQHCVYLSVYWRDYYDDSKSGRLTLCIPMRRPLLSFLTKYEATNSIAYLFGFKLEYQDHLELRSDCCSLDSAHEHALQAAKSLCFVERTGLLCARTTYGSESPFNILRGLEGTDHGTYWQSPSNANDWLYLDEPYDLHFDRPDWARIRRIGYTSDHGVGNGIYLGGGARACVFAPSQERAIELMDSLKAVTEEQKSWVITHGDYETDFVSPARFASGQNRRRRSQPVAEGTIRGGSIAYGGSPGGRSLWRPAEPMPLSMHNEIGPLIAALNDCTRFNSRYGYAITDLEVTLFSWLSAEHCDRTWFVINNPADRKYWLFEHAYKGLSEDGDLAAPAMAANDLVKTKTGKLQALLQIKKVLVAGYRDCSALRRLLKRLDFAFDRINTTTR
jgi:hypothetical protein